MSKMLRLLVLGLAMVALITSCQNVVVKAEAPVKNAISQVLTPGTPVWEVGLKSDLPADLEWFPVGTVESPTTFEREGVEVRVYFSETGSLRVKTNNHERVLGLCDSSLYKGQALTDGIEAKGYLTNYELGYAALGFKNEFLVYLIFEGSDIKIALKWQV